MIHLLFILYYLYCWYFAGKWNIVSRTPYYGPTHLLTLLRPFLIDILCCLCMNKFPAFQTGEERHIVLIYTMNIELRTLYPTSTVKTMSKVWCIVYLKTSPYYKYIYIYMYILYYCKTKLCQQYLRLLSDKQLFWPKVELTAQLVRIWICDFAVSIWQILYTVYSDHLSWVIWVFPTWYTPPT